MAWKVVNPGAVAVDHDAIMAERRPGPCLRIKPGLNTVKKRIETPGLRSRARDTGAVVALDLDLP
jgi:hypothetical protein